MPELHSSENILAVNIPEACRRISIGETLLRELMADGRLPFCRLPGAKRDSRGRIVIRVTDLDKLLIATRVDVAGKNARPARSRRKPAPQPSAATLADRELATAARPRRDPSGHLTRVGTAGLDDSDDMEVM
jgi:hypothetical protein